MLLICYQKNKRSQNEMGEPHPPSKQVYSINFIHYQGTFNHRIAVDLLWIKDVTVNPLEDGVVSWLTTFFSKSWLKRSESPAVVSHYGDEREVKKYYDLFTQQFGDFVKQQTLLNELSKRYQHRGICPFVHFQSNKPSWLNFIWLWIFLQLQISSAFGFFLRVLWVVKVF